MQVWSLIRLSTASVFSSVIALTLSIYPSFSTQSLDQVLLVSYCCSVICCKQGTGVNGWKRREHRPVTVIDSNNSGISNFNSTQLMCKSDKSPYGLYSTARKEWLRIPHETQSSYPCCWGPVFQQRLICKCVYIYIYTNAHVIFLFYIHFQLFYLLLCLPEEQLQDTVFSLLIFLFQCTFSSNSYYLIDSFYFYHPKESQSFGCWLTVYISDHMQLG